MGNEQQNHGVDNKIKVHNRRRGRKSTSNKNYEEDNEKIMSTCIMDLKELGKCKKTLKELRMANKWIFTTKKLKSRL